MAASVTAQLLNSSEQRAVGLFTIGGNNSHDNHIDVASTTDNAPSPEPEVIVRQPQRGQAHLWSILAALAPVQPSNIPLAELLRTAQRSLGRRSTLVVVTARPNALLPEADWPAQLVHLQATGVTSTVCLVTMAATQTKPGESGRVPDEPLRTLLARYNIPVQSFLTNAQFPAALTFRRTRKVIRSTPRGGVVTYEEEVEVG